MPSTKLLFAPLLTIALSACGFHLAGTRPLPAPLSTVFIDMQSPYHVEESPLQANLRSLLQRRGATVLAKEQASAPRLRLAHLTEQRETLSIGVDGRALEYRLILSVNYSVLQGQTILVAEDALTVQRDYSFSVEQILAKEAEEAQLRAYIQSQMAELLLLRIEAALSKAAAP